jgi:hypothetical protein
MQALDQTIYLLGDAKLRDGSALLPADNSDPGFLIRKMDLLSAEPPGSVLLDVEGLFWPVGVAGEDGKPIVRADIRAAFLPVTLTPSQPKLVAGGAAQDFTLEFGTVGTMRISNDGVTNAPFGGVIVSLVDAGGRQGAGTLSGGNAGPNSSRIIAVADGAASVRYTPPAQPALDLLVVSLEDPPGQANLNLATFWLQVRGA